MDSKTLLKDLFKAYYGARKNKRGTLNALKFEMEFEKNLFELRDELMERRYRIRPSICFINFSPVKREIFAADFRDRVVHHLIYNYINQIFEKLFVYDSYSCRVGKGTSLGVKRLDYFIRSCSQNYRKDCWILKLDIKGYFMAMDRNILFEKIKAVLERRKSELSTDLDFTLYLLRKIIFNDPTKNCAVRGKRENWIGLPKSKSLFFSGKDKGFPIGNLTSQLFGNIYLNDFDHFTKEKLDLKYYGRYVDDIVIVHRSREYLKRVVIKIKIFIRQIELKIHDKKIYLQCFKKGVLFLGVYLKPWRSHIGRRTKGEFWKALGKINKILAEKEKLSHEDRRKILAGINSYLGILKHYQTFRLRKKFLDLLNSKFWEYFFLDDNLAKLILNKAAFKANP